MRERRLVSDPSAGRRTTVRQQLRDATTTIHQALHDHPGFVRLLDGRLSREDYRTLLARLYGFHWPLEYGLRAARCELPGGFDVRERERCPAPRADLCVLGMTVPQIDAPPYCESIPPVRSSAEALGRLYVVEGAALGGRVLAAKLDSLLGGLGNMGRQFFSGRPAPDPLPWPAFCGWLEALGAGADMDEVIEGADTTFRAMAHWLAEGELNV
jgi:heme oxygenase